MNKNIVIEFAASLSEEELKGLTQKLSERFSGDLAEALDFMSNHKGMDSIFNSAETAEALYDKCDEVRDLLQRECRKKGLILKGKKGQAA